MLLVNSSETQAHLIQEHVGERSMSTSASEYVDKLERPSISSGTARSKSPAWTVPVVGWKA